MKLKLLTAGYFAVLLTIAAFLPGCRSVDSVSSRRPARRVQQVANVQGQPETLCLNHGTGEYDPCDMGGGYQDQGYQDPGYVQQQPMIMPVGGHPGVHYEDTSHQGIASNASNRQYPTRMYQRNRFVTGADGRVRRISPAPVERPSFFSRGITRPSRFVNRPTFASRPTVRVVSRPSYSSSRSSSSGFRSSPSRVSVRSR